MPAKFALASFAVLLLAVLGAARAAAVDDFFNVLVHVGADPSVVRHTDGWYYRTKTTGGNVTLWRSRTLTGTGGGESKVIWDPPSGTPYSSNLWAPELFFHDGKWFVYVAADDGDNANHRMYVLESANADPFSGSWTFRGQMTDSTDRWAIDGTVFTVGERMFTIWSGWPSGSNGTQNLYIAEMSNPWTISSNRVLIATPTHSWETNTSPTVNEGPEVIIRNGTINLVYSASGSWTNSYCLGLITAEVGSDLLDPASWTKRSTPVFASANGIYGPGHHSFTKSPDGAEDWIVYHCARYSGAGWTREIRAQKFTWNADDTPNFSSPVPRDVAIALPSGENERWRYEAEDAALSGSAAVSTSGSASGGQFVSGLDSTAGSLDFVVTVPVAGRYVIAARSATGTSNGESASFNVSANGGSTFSLSISNSGWLNWGVTAGRATLSAGANTIRVTKGSNTANFDAIDIFPFDPDGPAVTAPAPLLAEAGDRFVRLSWPKVTAEHYAVWRSQGGGPMLQIAEGLSMPAFVDHSVQNGVTYDYAVKAASWMGAESAFSPVATAMPGPGSSPKLVALYKMESGGRDSSSRGFHGVLEGGVATTAGRIDPLAAGFNGSLSNIEIPNLIGDSFTISYWVKTTATGGLGHWWDGQGLVDGEVGGVSNDFGLALVGDRVAFGVGNPDVTVTSETVVNDGNWHHVAATRDATTGAIDLHVDGVWQGGATGSTAARNGPRNLRIGSLQTAENYFTGSLDEVRIYDGVLPAETLEGLAAPDAKEVARYDFDGNFADATSFLHDGAAVGGVSFVPIRNGQPAAQFDGNSSIVIPASVAGDLSVACWVQTTATGAVGQWYAGLGIVDAEVVGVTEDFGLSLVGDKAAFGVGKPDKTTLSARSINDGQWHHVAATRSNSTGEVRVYIDGSLDAIGNASMPTGSRLAPTFFRIGAIATGSRPFVGAIDDVRIFNHVLTPEQVTEVGNRWPEFSDLPNLSIAENTPAGPIAVALTDSDTAAGDIELTVTSSNHDLVPPFAMELGGSGENRTLLITPAANRAGDVLITLSAFDGLNTSIEEFQLTVTTTPGGWWRQTWFGSTADAGNASGSADPDGDGLSNDWERFFAGNPWSGVIAGPTWEMDETHLQLEYPHSLAATDLQVRVEWSRDLVHWFTEGVDDAPVSNDGTVELRRGRILRNGELELFLRLKMGE